MAGPGVPAGMVGHAVPAVTAGPAVPAGTVSLAVRAGTAGPAIPCRDRGGPHTFWVFPRGINMQGSAEGVRTF